MVAHVQVKNLSFTYPGEKESAISNISFSVEKGEFVVLAGSSGCGKTTLLKHLKKELLPVGRYEGEILYDQKEYQQISSMVTAQEIGIVFQNPENQIVMDTVIQEIAFSLENIGCDSKIIQKRIAELVSFFGFQDLLHKSVHKLSGGQKQIVNLASVLVLKPKLLLLDEPTAQLDPIAAKEFLGLLKRIQEELGITVILSEHRLDEVMSISDRLIFMEKGKIIYDGQPEKVMKKFWDQPHLHPFIPQIPKLFLELGEKEIPFSVRDGQKKLHKYSFRRSTIPQEQNKKKPLLTAQTISFQYEKNGHFVLQDLSFTVSQGDSIALVGKNGTGKSTFLSVLAGLEKPRRGKVLYQGENIQKQPLLERYKQIGYISQNPSHHFSHDTVIEEVESRGKQLGIADAKKTAIEMLERFGIAHLKNRHPHDCSGGEQQLLALAVTFLSKPSILLLDEPTKGLDPIRKEQLGKLFTLWQKEGITIVMTTHDIEFAAMYMDCCAMLFDGQIVSEGTKEQFFDENFFYTTTINRLFGKLLPYAFTWKDVETV